MSMLIHKRKVWYGKVTEPLGGRACAHMFEGDGWMGTYGVWSVTLSHELV